MDRSWRPLFEALLVEHPAGAILDLDALAERTAPLGLSHEELGALMDALEREDRRVGEHERVDAAGALKLVMQAARELAREQGRRATLSELVARTGLPLVVVRRALQLGRVLGR